MDLTELVEFLRARLDEDEKIAKRAWPAAWEVTTSGVRSVEVGLQPGYEGLHTRVANVALTIGHFQSEARNAAHIARNDPARVLAQVRSHRKIVDWYEAVSERVEAVPALEPRQNELGMVLRALAESYTEHPDYRQEWTA